MILHQTEQRGQTEWIGSFEVWSWREGKQTSEGIPRGVFEVSQQTVQDDTGAAHPFGRPFALPIIPFPAPAKLP